MSQMRRYAVVRLLIVAIVACGSVLAAPIGAREASPTASPVAGGCTVWRSEAPVDPALADLCTLSAPWWTAWSSCAITPVQSDLYDAALAGGGVPATIPWVLAENASAVIVGHQFFGNRPLHVGGMFPDGASAKVLWHFAAPVRGLTMTAINLDDRSGAPVGIDTGPANTSPASTQWPSNLSIPSAGCWRVDLRATDEAGNPVTGSVTYIVVE